MFGEIKSQNTTALGLLLRGHGGSRLTGVPVFWLGVILGAVITRYLCDVGRGEKRLVQLPHNLF